MKNLPAAILLSILAFLLSSCERNPTDRPEVQAEIEAMQKDGWSFIEMVGEASSAPDENGRSIRRSDSSGSLTVYAMTSGADGSKQQEWEKTFKEQGFEFLEVKIMMSPADGYSLVFKRLR